MYGWVHYPTLFRAKPGQVKDAFSMAIDLAKDVGSKISYEHDEDGSFIQFGNHRALTTVIELLLKYAKQTIRDTNDPELLEDANFAIDIANQLKNPQ